ncbi:hypothetical protein [Paraflavitalea speifideaquila]|uniref:hypothetical protein n=1 Tax=Paraflavitalea speifideaquila TaxID=3076558 RepID=UPI0028E31941|nr:hypothetical protein [Paraflavitalea speifideiaquila]
MVAIDKAAKPTATATTPVAAKAEEKKQAVKASSTPVTAATGPLKADGTPDKRYKANQGTAAGPLKKMARPISGIRPTRRKANIVVKVTCTVSRSFCKSPGF